jgi:hypothetical protein
VTRSQTHQPYGYKSSFSTTLLSISMVHPESQPPMRRAYLGDCARSMRKPTVRSRGKLEYWALILTDPSGWIT